MYCFPHIPAAYTRRSPVLRYLQSTMDCQIAPTEALMRSHTVE
jgi:hypothetical protein